MTKVYYEKSESQKSYEVQNIVKPIKKMVPKAISGRSRGIKLPEYIHFCIDNENTLHIDINAYRAKDDKGTIFIKNPVCENMQTDNAAFEGWAICLKAWLKTIKKVKMSWVIPVKKNLHYNRFLYRALRFTEAFSEWFDVDERNKEEIKYFHIQYYDICNNSYHDEPKEKKKKKHKTFGETEMEYLMANKFKEQIKTSYGLRFVDRQLPVGLKKSGKQFFTGGMSAIDLWGLSEESMTIIELKYGTKNIKVGIISELFLYSCVARDIAKGIIAPPKTTPKKTEELLYKTANTIQSIKAEMLATDYHPLVKNTDIFNLLNDNTFKKDIYISFDKATYTYNQSQEYLKLDNQDDNYHS